MRSWSFLFSALPILIVASTVNAAGTAARERAAKKACLSGDPNKGVDLLTDLYLDSNDPVFIFDQGRCLEINRRYEDAIARFHEFIIKAKSATASDKEDAEKHIADCREMIAKQGGQPMTPATQPAVPGTIAKQEPVAAPAIAPPPETVQATNPSNSLAGASRLRTGGIITAAVGGAALLTGIILNLKVNSMASDLQKTDGYTDAKESDRKTYANLGWVSYGVGAACVATGAILYYLGMKPGQNVSTSVSLVPSFAPGQAGALLNGVF
jgi:hypothetical protein